MYKPLSFLTFLIFTASINAQTELDKKAIYQIVQDMAEGWTAGDGAAFAQHFADEHDYYVWNGLYTRNMTKAENARTHQGIFNTMYKNTNHYAFVDQIRFIRPDVAVIMVMSAVEKKSNPRPEYPDVLWSATLSKENGQWKIFSFHNSDIEILETAETRENSPIPVEVMYGSWARQNMK